MGGLLLSGEIKTALGGCFLGDKIGQYIHFINDY